MLQGPHPVAGLALFLVLVCLLGSLVDDTLRDLLAGPRRAGENRTPALRRAPVWFVLGATVYSFVAMLCSIAGLMLSRGTGVAVLAAAAIARAGARRIGGSGRSPRPEAPPAAGGRDWLAAALIAGAIALLALRTAGALSRPALHIDLVGHQLIKAKILLHETYAGELFFHDPLFANLHGRYPPLFGILFNLLFLFVGGSTPGHFTIVNHLLLLGIATSVYDMLRERLPPLVAALSFGVVLSTRAYLANGNVMENADLLLSLFFAVAAFEACRYVAGGGPERLAVSALAAGGAALLKNEGIAFLLTLTAFVLLARRGQLSVRQRLPGAGAYLLTAAAPVVPWLLYRQRLPSPDHIHELLLGSATGTQLASYFPQLLGEIIVAVCDPQWGFVFPALALSVALLWERGAGTTWWGLTFATGVQVLVYFTVYLVVYAGAPPPYTPGVLERLISHVYPLALAGLATSAATLLRGERD